MSLLGAAHVNRLLLADDLALLHLLNRTFNLKLIDFLLHVTKPEIKLALKRLKCYASPETQGSECCK